MKQIDDYKLFLKSPIWKAIRERKFKSCGCVCEKGNSRVWKKQANIHHKNYNQLWGEEKDEDLIILCKVCHKRLHRVLKFHAYLCPNCCSPMKEAEYYYDRVKDFEFTYLCTNEKCNAQFGTNENVEKYIGKLKMEFFDLEK